MFQAQNERYRQYGLSGPDAFLRPASAKYLEELHRTYGVLKGAPRRGEVSKSHATHVEQQRKLTEELGFWKQQAHAMREERDRYASYNMDRMAQFLVPNQDVGGGGDGDGGDGDRGARSSVVPPVQAEAGDGPQVNSDAVTKHSDDGRADSSGDRDGGGSAPAEPAEPAPGERDGTEAGTPELAEADRADPPGPTEDNRVPERGE